MTYEECLEIDCDEHGKGVAAVVCGHLLLNNGTPLGIVENCTEPGDLQAWCYACEYVFEQEEDLTEAFKKFNNMKLVCEECYSQIKKRHLVEL